MDHSGPILVVEDDDDTRTMVSTVLEFEGHEVITAANGREAFERARQDHPCLILLDLMMPVMTGEQFRAAQLAEPSIEDIPVIVLSAHHDAAAIARRMNVAGCLQKPLDFDALQAIVKRRCGS
jgi:CheY-like chemotaxis protein